MTKIEQHLRSGFLVVAAFLLSQLGALSADEFTLSPREMKIEAFLKANYCEVEQDTAPFSDPEAVDPELRDRPQSASQDGEGRDAWDAMDEDNFCIVKRNIVINPAIKVLSDDKIEVTPPSPENPTDTFIWTTVRKGSVPDEIKQTVYKKLVAIQMPPAELSKTLFQVWKINIDDDAYEEFLVHAYYKRLNSKDGMKGFVCEITLVLDKKSRNEKTYSITTLNKIPFKEVDFETDTNIQKNLYDIRDTDGDKKLELILLSEGFEASWLEVYARRAQGWFQVYKGLGYSF